MTTSPRVSCLFTVGWFLIHLLTSDGDTSYLSYQAPCTLEAVKFPVCQMTSRWLRTVPVLLPAFRDKLIPMQEVDRGERTDQQRFYDQLNIAFLVLGYVRQGACIAKAERQYKAERDHAITLPNQASNLVPSY